MKKITQLGLVLSLIIFASCDDSKATFEIQKNKVGPIEATTEINQLDAIFAEDSIVKPDLENRFRSSQKDIYIYHKGELSLKIQPRKSKDSTSHISEIQILNPAYKTAEGLHADATFKDLAENFKIKNIQNSLKNIIVDIEDSGIYVVIDKKHLPSSLRHDSSAQISKTQIPDDAPFKYFWFSFTEE